ncbi:uncharacterized protein LOC123469848 [Daphnia magna]|uniref:uncharacterized protein LOC123469848 n=1 Tax=Daphnia magna TaxID=35525 RepID=UPI001E1BAD28|nr:uncharacterized protein LOC123469848 [Daphnia magna]
MKLRKETTGYDGTTLGDVQSGKCYREKVRGDGSENQVIFTAQLNVDGAQSFKKSKFGIWPFMGVINEIPYGARQAHMILMALWFGNKKPPRGPFLDTSIAELKHLGSSGMKFGELTVFLRPLVLTTDSMARTVFLDGTICRGEFGCDFCLHAGETTKIGRGSARVYPEPTTNPTFPLRTIEQHEKDLMIALEMGKPVHGIKGPSPFLALTFFDYVTAQVPDYLHSVCQGAIKCLLEFWTDSKYHTELWHLNKHKLAIIDARLSQMRPPYEVTRTSALVSNLGDWKASEYRAFALYYFSALEDLLPKQFYDHFLCLVYGLQVLLQEEVAVERVKEVEFIFQYFVREAEVLYGRKRIRYNFHLLTHLVQSALNWGLPWSNSTFIPEWFNGELISLKNGTQCVAEQMVKSFLLKKAVRSDAISLITNFNLPITVSALLRKLLNISQKEAFYSHINQDFGSSYGTIKLLGSALKKKPTLFMKSRF